MLVQGCSNSQGQRPQKTQRPEGAHHYKEVLSLSATCRYLQSVLRQSMHSKEIPHDHIAHVLEPDKEYDYPDYLAGMV